MPCRSLSHGFCGLQTIGMASNPTAPWETDNSGVAQLATVLRIVRLVRVFRIFKLSRYSVGLQLFYGALYRSAMSLTILGFLMLIATILFSSMMYLAEAEYEDDDNCHTALASARPLPVECQCTRTL